jgi:hypothetical protein
MTILVGDWANPRVMKIVGVILLCVFVAVDAFIRIRLKRAGHKWVFLRGATLDYGEYRKVGSKYGWSTWPVVVDLVDRRDGAIYRSTVTFLRARASAAKCESRSQISKCKFQNGLPNALELLRRGMTSHNGEEPTTRRSLVVATNAHSMSVGRSGEETGASGGLEQAGDFQADDAGHAAAEVLHLARELFVDAASGFVDRG